MKTARVIAVLLAAVALLEAMPALAAAPPPFDGLKEIEAFSEASSRGDEAAVAALLADQILFSAGDGAVQREPKWDRTDPVTTLIEKKTLVLRTAAAKGDRASISPILDQQLIFVNEDGDVSGRRDLRLGAPRSLGPAASTVKLEDWVARPAGGVVVCAYVIDTQIQYGQQSVDDRALAVDTWIRRGPDWKLIESQAIPLNQDARVAKLEPAALDDYAGAYAAAPNFTVAITRDGDALALSTNGAKPVQALPEAKDIFFVPSQQSGVRRSRIIFQRDAGGHITGYVSSRGLALRRIAAVGPTDPGAVPLKVGSAVAPATDLVVHRLGALAVTSFIHDRITAYPAQTLHTRYRSTEAWIRGPAGWKMVTLQSLELPVEPPPAPLSPELLNDYVGDYFAAAGVSYRIARVGDHLEISQAGEKPATLVPMARDSFFVPGHPRNTLLFQRDASGRLLGYFLRREGRDLAFRKP